MKKMKRKMAVLITAVFMGGLGWFSGFTGSDEISAGNSKEMLYVTGYDYTFAIDPGKKEMVAKIPIKGPNRDMTWTEDGKRIFVNSGQRQQVAMIDASKNEVIETISFNKEKVISRIYGMAVDPKGEKLYANLMRAERKPSELIRMKPVIAVMDLKTKQVVKEIEVPLGTHALQFLADGTRLAVWAKDLYLYDTEKDELKKYKELLNPTDPNKQGIYNFLYFWNRDRDSANALTAGMFKLLPDTGAMEEHIFMVDRNTAEITDINLGEPIGLFSVVVSPDKKFAYGGMNYIHKINLQSKEVKSIYHPPGTSYGYNLSGDGKTLYVSGAGPEISFIDTRTMEYVKTVDLPTDTMDVRVVQIQQ